MKVVLDKKSSGKIKGTYRGKHFARLFFNSDKPMTTDQVQEYATVYSKKYKEKGATGQMAVSCYFEGIGWRGGYVCDFGEELDIYDPARWYDQPVQFNEKCKRFCITVIGASKAEGGCDDKFNDCLFHCIRQAYGSEENMPQAIDKPWKLKKLLGLERNDKVPLDKLPMLEEKLPKCSITVYGDYQYVSSKSAPMNIKLKLSNEHYQLVNNDNRTKTAKTKFKPVNKENVYSYSSVLGKIYNGTEKDATREEIREMQNSPNYLMLYSTSSLKETYDNFISMADNLLTITDNKLNLYKYPSIPVASMDIFRYMSKLLKEPEPISAVEAPIISKAFQGGLYYADNTYEGYGKVLDVNSMYPAMMVDKYLQLAMSEGEPKTLTDDEFKMCREKKHFRYGFYRCKVMKSNDVNKDKFFRFSKTDTYTHYDLLAATELGLDMTLIQDSQWNFYFYERSKLGPSHTIFKPFVDYCYKLKQQYKPAKTLLNSLWGALCEKDRHTLRLNPDMDFTVHDDLNIKIALPTRKEELKLEYEKPEHMYKTDYARIGPFLTAYARLKLMRAAKPYADHIVRIHTDAIVLNKDIKVDLKIDDEMGNWKVEYEGHLSVKNISDIKKKK